MASTIALKQALRPACRGEKELAGLWAVFRAAFGAIGQVSNALTLAAFIVLTLAMLVAILYIVRLGYDLERRKQRILLIGSLPEKERSMAVVAELEEKKKVLVRVVVPFLAVILAVLSTSKVYTVDMISNEVSQPPLVTPPPVTPITESDFTDDKLISATAQPTPLGTNADTETCVLAPPNMAFVKGSGTLEVIKDERGGVGQAGNPRWITNPGPEQICVHLTAQPSQGNQKAEIIVKLHAKTVPKS